MDIKKSYYEIEKKINILFGFISFVNLNRTKKLKLISENYPTSEIDNNYSNIDLKYKFQHFDNNINLEPFEKLVNIKLNEKASKYVELLKNMLNNNKFLDFTYNVLEMYYIASKEKNLTLSFMNYWSIMEYIIKLNKREKYKELKRIITNIFKYNVIYYNDNDYIDITVDLIFKKRNNFVHEGKNQITQIDRNFIFETVNLLIDIFFLSSKKFENVDCYRYFLKNINLESIDFEKKRNQDKINVLNIINSEIIKTNKINKIHELLKSKPCFLKEFVKIDSSLMNQINSIERYEENIDKIVESSNPSNEYETEFKKEGFKNFLSSKLIKFFFESFSKEV